jgi:hypothetical protein
MAWPPRALAGQSQPEPAQHVRLVQTKHQTRIITCNVPPRFASATRLNLLLHAPQA